MSDRNFIRLLWLIFWAWLLTTGDPDIISLLTTWLGNHL